MRIHSRLLTLLTVVFFTVACQPAGIAAGPTAVETTSAATVLSQREYSVELRLDLTNSGPGIPEKQNLWVALIRDAPPYQAVTALTISPADYTLVTDEYGNQFAEFDLSDHPAGSVKTVQIGARVLVNELGYELADCSGEMPGEFVQPELHIESANPQIVELSERISAGRDTACERVRAFYDYLGDELTYSYNGRNWGAQAALGTMGADCTEYTSLLIALSRAQGIPARYFEGLRYLDSASESGAHVEHAWPDVYLPGAGWVAMDPTLGRSSLSRTTYFAHHTPDHIIVTTGRNPSTLRGSSYWTHLYWPGQAANITVESAGWKILLVSESGSSISPPAQVGVHDDRQDDDQPVDQLGPEPG
jgi:transglutaminase-like putative cysteine protease